MYGFYSRSEEESGLVSKTEGVAKLVALIGIGVAARPYVAKLAGKAVGSLASKLTGRLNIRSPLGAQAELFDDTINAFTDFAGSYRTAAANQLAHTQRVDLAFDAIAEQIEPSQKADFIALKDEILPQLSIFGKIGNMEDRDVETVLGSVSFKKIREITERRGLKFQADFEANHRKIFEEILGNTTKKAPSQLEVDRYLGEANNQAELKKAFDYFFAQEQKRQKLSNKLIDVEGAGWSHVTGAQLLDDDEVINSTDTFLKKVGLSGESNVDTITKSIEDSWVGPNGLFRGTDLEEAREKAWLQDKLRQSTTTGLIRNNKTGEVASISKLRKEAKSLTNSLLDELQIPLVPFKFNVPLRTFKFMSPTGERIRSLGTLSSEPELTRELKARGYSQEELNYTKGLGVDNKLLTFGPEGVKFHEDFNIVSYDKRHNKNIEKLASVRDLDPENFSVYGRNFGNAEDSMSNTQIRILQHTPKYTDLHYDPARNGFLIRPKEGIGLLKSAVSRIFHPNKIIPIDEIHPVQLSEWLKTQDPSSPGYATIDKHLMRDVQKQILTEASNDRQDIGPLLKSLQDFLPSNSPHLQAIRSMLDNADNPQGLIEALTHLQSDLDSSGERIYGNIAPELYRSFQVFNKRPDTLFEVSQGQSGFMNTQKSDFAGQSGIGPGLEKFQEGLLSHVLREYSIGDLSDKLAGGSSPADEIVKALTILRGNADQAEPFKLINQENGFLAGAGIELRRRFARLGLTDSSEDGLSVRGISFIESMFDKEGTISRDALGKFSLSTMDLEEKANILLRTSTTVEKSKIIRDMSQALNSFNVMRDDHGVGTQVSLLNEMMANFDTHSAIVSRFDGRPFIPKPKSLSPLNTSDYYTTLHEGFDLSAGNYGTQLKQQIARRFGLDSFIHSLVDPEKALGGFAAATQMLLTMPQAIGDSIGIGLRGQDRITALRTSVGFYGKRLLPLIIGYEAYKNHNANMHEMGLPGLDDLGANLLANANLIGAEVKDVLGVTQINQWAVATLPGLDQYFTPRSKEEYQEHLKYGDEEVREGRGWVIGSRGNLTGSKIKYTRPNYYRRWKSHWTEADNVDISNPAYSFLPNLLHPLAPLRALLNPDWFEEKHRDDRPYMAGGKYGHNNAWASNDSYITINSDGRHGALGIGEIGGGYPISMTGGGTDVSFDFKTKQLVSGTEQGGSSSASPNEKNAMGVYAGTYQTHTYGLEAAGKPIRLGLHKGVDESQLVGWSLGGVLAEAAQTLRAQSGLYGAFMQRIPFYPTEAPGFTRQDSSYVRSFSRVAWMGEYGELPGLGIGTAKEFFRRFIGSEIEAYDAYSPYANNMPSWLPEKFKTGDPYTRTPGIGELQLPGEAWELTHPWVAPLKVRGSAIGLSEKEMIQKWLNPLEEIEGQDSEDIVEFGSAVHLQVQRQLRQIGALVGAEVSIFDKENNLSGTVDAIVNGPQGLEILEVKTQGAKSWGSTPQQYKDQLMFYMATTGIKRGSIAFVNRDDTQQVRVVPVEFDPARWQEVLDKVGRARSTMNSLADQGLISPFESYDLVSRIEVLAKVAPGSVEFREHVQKAVNGGLGGFEKQRVEAAVKQANSLNEDFHLYNKRFGVTMATASFDVEGISKRGEIITSNGVLKLAGIDFDPQAFSFYDAEDVLSQYGIEVGDSIRVQMQKGAMNPDIMVDTVTPVIVGDVNKSLVSDGYADWGDDTTEDPIASYARFGNSPIGKLWESMVHSDNLITNKFMRVRTPLEQFERGEVFGTDKAKWNDPIGTIVTPTLHSLANKNPITSGIMGAIIGAMFARTNSPTSKIPMLRNKLAIGGAALGAALSTARSIYEIATDTTWTPSRYREQAEFDEYWDTIKYLKYTAIAESTKKLAIAREDVNIDKMRDEERQTVGLGPYAILAIDAERRAKRTMFGYSVATGSLQDALSSIPDRQQQIAREIILNGSLEEKQRFYDLLPDAQRRVIGKFLGVEKNQLPSAPNLTQYFQTHFLPDDNWEGWAANIDLNDIENRAAALEGVKIQQPNRSKVAKSRAVTNNIPVPRMDNPTYGNIKRQIRNLLATGGYHNIDVDFKMLPSDSSVVNIDMNLFDDETERLIEHYKEGL